MARSVVCVIVLLFAAAGCGNAMPSEEQRQGSAGATAGGAGGQANTPISLAIQPRQAAAGLSGFVQFTAIVSGTDDIAVAWSVDEPNGGSVSSSGRYSAPSVAGTYHVSATSHADPKMKDHATVTVGAVAGTPPALVVDRWTEITPPIPYQLDAGHAGIISFAIDPSAPDTLYVGIEGPGLIRSTDRGATWQALGHSDPDPYDDESSFLDLPVSIAVDPHESQHLYVTEGVRGAANGFWVSHDGGSSWLRKKSDDLTSRAIDPLDFNHVLVGTHNFMPSLYETKDGGDTWRSIPLPFGDGGSFGVRMLFDPLTNQGDSSTWLLHGPGHFRTTDAGATWTKVSDIGAVHGGDGQFYGPDGVLYSGAWDGMALSKDNGITWQRISDGIAYGSFQTGTTDGTRLFTMQTNNWGNDVALLTASGTDGEHWQPYAAASQKFALGANGLYFDAANRILYSTNMSSGLWAIKLGEP